MDASNNPPFAWVMDRPGTFGRLVDNPWLLHGRHARVFKNDEERIGIETSLFMHQHHHLAFSEFPDFASEFMDPLAGLSRREILEITPNTCPQLPVTSKSSWPWKRTDTSIPFDAGITMGTQADNPERTISIITMSAQNPMNHLALLWALQKGLIRLLPIMVMRHSILIMIIDPDKSDPTQIEVIYDDPDKEIRGLLLRDQQLQKSRSMLLAVPRTMFTWMDISVPPDGGDFISHDWPNHALFYLGRVGQRCSYCPIRVQEDSNIFNSLSKMIFESSRVGTSTES